MSHSLQQEEGVQTETETNPLIQGCGSGSSGVNFEEKKCKEINKIYTFLLKNEENIDQLHGFLILSNLYSLFKLYKVILYKFCKAGSGSGSTLRKTAGSGS